MFYERVDYITYMLCVEYDKIRSFRISYNTANLQSAFGKIHYRTNFEQVLK